MSSVPKCPECGSDDVEIDPPYAECISCGHQGQTSAFGDTTKEAK